MAKQYGPFLLKGTLQQTTFYQMDGRFIVRAKSSLTKKRVKADPAFAGSRNASTEFGRAGTAAMILRQTFRQSGTLLGDTRLQGRLTGLFTLLMDTDTQNRKGERQIQNTDLTRLAGLEWNRRQALHTLLRLPLCTGFNSAINTVEMLIPAIDPGQSLQIPDGATHYEVMLAAAAIDFTSNERIQAQASTGWRALAAGIIAQEELKAGLPARQHHWVFGGAGIRFGMGQGGIVLPLKDKAYQAFSMPLVELVS